MNGRGWIVLGIVDTCVTAILKEFPLTPDEREGYASGLSLPWDAEERIKEMYPRPGAVEEEGEEMLGHYEVIASPGRLVLHLHPLKSFFWHHALDIFRAGYYIEQSDLRFMCDMVVLKTYTHEQFHHFCDIARHLFGCRYDRLREEALAVAWSYFQIEAQRQQWSSKEARLSAGIYRELLPKVFRYSAPCYRDWVNFRLRADFEKALIDYTGPHSSSVLGYNGIDMSRVLVKILEETKAQGVIESIE